MRIKIIEFIFNRCLRRPTGLGHFINGEDGNEQIEVWFARKLQILLGYTRWENFIIAVLRAAYSCKMQGVNVYDHFRDLTKMIEIGKD